MAKKKSTPRAVPAPGVATVVKSTELKHVPARKGNPQAATTLPTGYAPLFADLKVRVRSAQLTAAAVSVNRELILLYWHIGREILRCQHAQGWGRRSWTA